MVRSKIIQIADFLLKAPVFPASLSILNESNESVRALKIGKKSQMKWWTQWLTDFGFDIYLSLKLISTLIFSDFNFLSVI